MIIFVPVTVYEVPVLYSICLILSTTSVLVLVSEVMVPLVKLGTIGTAWQGVKTPVAKSNTGAIRFI